MATCSACRFRHPRSGNLDAGVPGFPAYAPSLLMFTSNEELLPGHFNNQGLYISEISGRPVDDEGAEVTHWMYAPEPPDMDDVEELPCC